jgi:hypothetical protein
MRKNAQIAILAFLVLAGCHNTQPQPPITREALVGNYVYHSEDDRPLVKASDHEWDHLTLRADDTYDLVQGGPTKPKSEKVGRWTFWPGGTDSSEVMLDHAGFPIQVEGNEVRLIIDGEIRIWYSKVK